MPTPTSTPKRQKTTGKVLYKANYGNATLSDVTRAVLRYRPKRVTTTDENPPRTDS